MSNFLSGLGSAVGDLGSTMLSGYFNKKEAKKNREFQTDMDNTRFQRAAADLEKAGLNRILSLGSPGSAPSGAVATLPDAKLGSSFQQGSSAKAQRAVASAEERLIGEKQTTEQASQDLMKEQGAAIAAKVESEINVNNANAASALTAAKRGSGLAEISDAIAEVIREIRNPGPQGQKGIIPKVVEKLPGVILGEKGVNSARKVGKTLYETLHGTIEEQSKERQERWKREDAKKKSQTDYKNRGRGSKAK